MAYASGATLATLFGEIDVWLRNEPLYKNENLEAGVLVGIYNRLIDALHLGALPEMDVVSFTSVVGQAIYPIDGTTAPVIYPTFNHIVRLDYAGDALEQILAVEQWTAPLTADANATPERFTVYWDGGVQQLAFEEKCDTAQTVTLWVTRQATNATAATAIPSIGKDLWGILWSGILAELYRRMGKLDMAAIYDPEGFLSVASQERRIAQHRHERAGRSVRRRQGVGTDELLA